MGNHMENKNRKTHWLLATAAATDKRKTQFNKNRVTLKHWSEKMISGFFVLPTAVFLLVLSGKTLIGTVHLLATG